MKAADALKHDAKVHHPCVVYQVEVCADRVEIAIKPDPRFGIVVGDSLWITSPITCGSCCDAVPGTPVGSD